MRSRIYDADEGFFTERAWWWICVAATVALPAVWSGWVAITVLVVPHATAAVSVLLTIVSLVLLAGVGIAGLVFALHGLDCFRIGWTVLVIAVMALYVGGGAVLFSADRWLLDLAGVETTCTVVERREADRGIPLAASLPEDDADDDDRYFEHEIRCADERAPDAVIARELPEGERVEVVYDPRRTLTPRPAAEVSQGVTEWRIGLIGIAVWMAANLVSAMRERPLRPHH
ncbi:hypothetical protein [Glycomyces terrestris]|uniref:DUF3592 domain-containing protein n=1 Tax=Glycomyces terrestris TaxID=2493553 RepID=A0A426V3Q9_9ACTN|nr:hypothetical protein [Glycomyces terrestris]RRS01506.1 hypothetical protein EIW28_01690 [Glycomyces terrestris]